MKPLLTVLLLLTLSTNIFAQNQQVIGIVKDASGQAIPGAAVYVAGTKLATVTDTDGKFNIGLAPGRYDLLFQMLGFQPANEQVEIDTRSVTLRVQLKESLTNIREVVIVPDKNRRRYIELFKQYFIGTTPNAEKTRILNPEVLRVDYEKDSRKLKVTADEFLEVENAALGYKIKYLLKYFEHDHRTNVVYYEGYPTFEELPGSAAAKRRWIRARTTAYNGSMMHFFRSLANGTTAKDGFVIHKIADGQFPTATTPTANPTFFNPRISLNGQKRPRVLRQENVRADTLVHREGNDRYYLNFTDDLYLLYTREQEHKTYRQSPYFQARPFDIGNDQISVVTPLRRPIWFYRNGTTADPQESLFSGYFAYEKVADQLPAEYEPLPRATR